MTREVITRTPAGHVVAEDAEHVARAVRAIKLRRLAEIELNFAPPRKSTVLQFNRRKRKS